MIITDPAWTILANSLVIIYPNEMSRYRMSVVER